MTKPTVFNYNDFLRMQEERDKLKKENWELQERNRQLRIRCTVLKTNLQEWQEAVVYIKVPEVPGPGDAINREDAISHFRELAETLRGEYGDLRGACSGAAKFLERMPRADIAPEKQSETTPARQSKIVSVVSRNGERITHWLACGACKEPVDFTDKYCKHCGVRLVSDEDGGDHDK